MLRAASIGTGDATRPTTRYRRRRRSTTSRGVRRLPHDRRSEPPRSGGCTSPSRREACRIGAAIVAELTAAAARDGIERVVLETGPRQRLVAGALRAVRLSALRLLERARRRSRRGLLGEVADRRAEPFSLNAMLAVIVVRGGVLPAGAHEAVSECGGRALLVGSGTATAATRADRRRRRGHRHRARRLPAGGVGRGARRSTSTTSRSSSSRRRPTAATSPRGWPPQLQRPLYAQALGVSATEVDLVRRRGTRAALDRARRRVRGHAATGRARRRSRRPARRRVRTVGRDRRRRRRPGQSRACCHPTRPRSTSPKPLASSPAAPGSTTGDGSTSSPRWARALRASVGATRVITDRGWVGHERQIGTTGVVVDPELYIAFGISGAVQHTSGLGRPAAHHQRQHRCATAR